MNRFQKTKERNKWNNKNKQWNKNGRMKGINSLIK